MFPGCCDRDDVHFEVDFGGVPGYELVHATREVVGIASPESVSHVLIRALAPRPSAVAAMRQMVSKSPLFQLGSS